MNKRKQILEEDAAKTYNEFKVFEGKKYTGMRVGGRHKWYYEKGRVEREKGYPGPLGIQLCGTETACRPCPSGLRCSGRDRIPLVHSRASERTEA